MKNGVYVFANNLMHDAEFNRGGICLEEREWLDNVGFEYTVKGGVIVNTGEDAQKFYSAMATLLELHNKYDKEE